MWKVLVPVVSTSGGLVNIRLIYFGIGYLAISTYFFRLK